MPSRRGRLVTFVCAAAILGGSADMRAAEWTTLHGVVRAEAARISSGALAEPLGPEAWRASVDSRREQWREMLGLSPLPLRTPLAVRVTGTLDRDGYVVEKLAFEAVPGALVFGNLYRPPVVDRPLPAVLYLCGHSLGKANPEYQAQGRWFGSHGYVALVLDPIQLGESKGFHHGTYNGGRWDWPSRGYTPAGAETWNAIRALDYLETRADVDAGRMGVTGLSGGGAVSWWLGAADERVKVVVPVCQSGSIEQVVADRGVDGHCDCAFWLNYRRWCWPDVGGLIAPRRLMIAAGSRDMLWRPGGYRPTADRIRRQYAALGVADRFALVEDDVPHGYSPALRRAIFGWFNTHLRSDPAPVTDDVTPHVEPAENLRVFADPPAADRMDEIATLLFVRPQVPEISDSATWERHRADALAALRRTTFGQTMPPAPPRVIETRDDGDSGDAAIATVAFETCDGLPIALRTWRPRRGTPGGPLLVTAARADALSAFGGGGLSRPRLAAPLATAVVEVRGTTATSLGTGFLWTLRRTCPLLGQTLPERQVADLLGGIAVARGDAATGPVAVFGTGPTAVLAIYATILDPDITELVVADPPVTHEDPATPEFLGILRTGDLPANLALVFPRPITFVGGMPEAYEWTRRAYERFGAADRIRVIPCLSAWEPWTPRQ